MKKPHCRSCNAKDETQFIRATNVFGSKGKHKFFQCERCGLVYLWPIPSPEKEKIFYSQEFEKFMEIRSGGDRDWSSAEAHYKSNQDQIERRRKFLKNELVAGKDILEIGCSSGFMMDLFKKKGMNPIGIEPSGVFSNFLEMEGHISFPSIENFIKNNPRKKFDLIVNFFVMEHINDTKLFIQQQLNLLKKNGKIIAEVPCVNDPLISLYKIPAFEKFYWSIAHNYYFSPKSLSFILDQLDCHYKFIPEQRYDLSNHLVWMQEGKPGGQGKYNSVFSKKTINNYAKDLKEKWICDTFILYITK